MIFNINYYKSLSDQNYGDVLIAVNSATKSFIIFRMALDAIFVVIIMTAIYDTGIFDKRLHAFIAFIFAFNSAELMTNCILGYFIRKKVMNILGVKPV